jgi:hypothetical protein
MSAQPRRGKAPAPAQSPVDAARAMADALSGKVQQGAQEQSQRVLQQGGQALDARAQEATAKRAQERAQLSGAAGAPFAVPFVAPDQKTLREGLASMSPEEKAAVARIDAQLGGSGITAEQRAGLQRLKEQYLKSTATGGDRIDLDAMANEVLGKRKPRADDSDFISRPGDVMPLEDRLKHADYLKKLLQEGRMNPEQTRAAIAEIKAIENAAQIGLARTDLAVAAGPETAALVPETLRNRTPVGTSIQQNMPVEGPVDRPFQEEAPEPPMESSATPPLPAPVQEEAKIIAKETPVEEIIKEVLTDMEEDEKSPGWNILDLIEAFAKGYAGTGHDTRLRRQYEQMIKDKAAKTLRQQELEDQETQMGLRLGEEQRGQAFTRERDAARHQQALEIERLRRPGAELTMGGGRPNFLADGLGLFD